VNLLVNKLEIVTKNIEMANVCCVPLSYLFIRGQGIKLFSLCLKEFREQEYAFPVIKIDKTYQCSDCNTIFKNSKYCTSCNLNNVIEIETEQSTYEGAIVFNPVPKVEYEACATKDYMSLYPASIMHKNMSHETIVEDEKYDNLPDITYYNAYYKEANGLIQYKRFAKKDNKLGVIPSIFVGCRFILI
jgi:DNA polymerase elongation subunit (family B)